MGPGSPCEKGLRGLGKSSKETDGETVESPHKRVHGSNANEKNGHLFSAASGSDYVAAALSVSTGRCPRESLGWWKAHPVCAIGVIVGEVVDALASPCAMCSLILLQVLNGHVGCLISDLY